MSNDYIYVYVCYLYVCSYKNVIFDIDIQYTHHIDKIHKLLYYID